MPDYLLCEPALEVVDPTFRSVRVTSDHTPTTLSADLYSVRLEGGPHTPMVHGLTWAEIEPLACAWLAGAGGEA